MENTPGEADKVSSEPTDQQVVTTRLKTIGCFAFTVVTLILWLVSENWFVFLLLFIPYYIFEEWLSSKLFSGHSRWSVAESGFSVLRIAFGVMIVLLLGLLAYGLLISFHWLAR